MTALLPLLLAAAPGEWTLVDVADAMKVESRSVPDARVVELRVTATVTASPERLCEEAFGTGKYDPTEPDLKSRKVVEETADTRVTYEQISPPLIANRDYAVRAVRERPAEGTCRVTFTAANDLAPPLPSGWVRIEKLRGEWLFEAEAPGKTRLTYSILSDPAGAVPVFLVEGSRRKFALQWVKLIATRAAQEKDAGR